MKSLPLNKNKKIKSLHPEKLYEVVNAETNLSANKTRLFKSILKW